MNMKFEVPFVVLLFLLGSFSAGAQVIVLPEKPTAVEKTAASTLQEELQKISGKTLSIVSEADAPKPRKTPFLFYVGETKAAAKVHSGAWSEDEILIRPVKGGMVLTGHPTRGALYAVNTLIEDGYGVRWWTSKESDYPSREILPVPEMDLSFAPPLKYREASCLDAYDPDFRLRLKGNFASRIRWCTEQIGYIPAEKGGCHRLLFFEGRQSAYHSFFEILPPKKHFEAHPEWYSLINGKREPRQLCLTNAEMEKAFIQETLRLLREHPEVDFLSVSQNDWRDPCTCDACKAVEEQTGGVHSGPVLQFVNRVAEAVEKEFPHVTVETFAYQYTRPAPKNVKPRHNVLIRLCDIECPFSIPFESSDLPVAQSFKKDFADWAALAPGQVFIWDYVTNFRSYQIPHPNLLSYGPNMQYFAKNGAVGVFEQGNTCARVGDLDPLRLWLLSHLLWDPYADDKALIDEFIRGYWGEAAAPHIQRYISLIHDPVISGNIPVRCYHRDGEGWILPATMVAAAQAMDAAAEAAAQAGEPYATRVRKETLSPRQLLLFHWAACREYCKGQNIPWTWGDTVAEATRKWEDDCRAFGVVTPRECTAEQAPARMEERVTFLKSNDAAK